MSRAAAFSGRPSRFSKFACAVHSVSSPEPFTSSQWNTATRDGERSAAELRELEQLLADIDAIIGLARRSPNRGETGLARKHAVGCSTKRRLPPERRIQSTRGRPCRRHRWRFEIVPYKLIHAHARLNAADRARLAQGLATTLGVAVGLEAHERER
jgi:hypothetical protein